MSYFIDLCWVVNYFFALLAFNAAIEVADSYFGDYIPTMPLFGRLATAYPVVGRIFCLAACGPLAGSVYTLGCKLIFHDIVNYTNTFIHLWPMLTTLAVRWNKEAVRTTFHMSPSVQAVIQFGSDVTFFQLILEAVAAYMMWFLPYTVWLCVQGRFLSPKNTGHDTIYLYTFRTLPPMRKICGVSSPKDPQYDSDVKKLSVVLKYMGMHAAMNSVGFVISAVCYLHIYLHAAYCIICVLYAVYAGSKWYDYKLTKLYGEKMKKFINDKYPGRAWQEGDQTTGHMKNTPVKPKKY